MKNLLTNLEDFVLVRFKGVEFQAQITHVPKSDSFVSASSGENVFRIWVEREAVNFLHVSFNLVSWLGTSLFSD